MSSPRPPRKRNIELGETFVVALLVASGAGCAYLRGWEGIWRALRFSADLLLEITPMMVLSLVLAGLVQVLVPHEKVSRWLGADSGWRGLTIASVAGALVPGGPWASFPLLFAIGAAGADIGSLVAFLSAWELLAISRIVVWELPMMGGEFVFIRLVASIALPVLAGIIARRIPLPLNLPRPPRSVGRSS
ncbi:MAG: hypothetical protein EXQ91_03410 [Alphaproteobacteria bacterium]|nr:hypothetical protein [Alphaproteobacteria bacterium]